MKHGHTEVREFYDEYVAEQANTGINDRIYGVYERLIGLGLNAQSSVLELGCGIGMMTSLLKRKINEGRIHAIDLSEASIAYGKEHISTPNITFSTQDITAFETALKQPDFITLIDVLEHIPLEKHATLFQRISAIMGLNSHFVINLPNPDYIAHDIALEADSLQVIDQPVPFASLIQQLDDAGLELMKYEKYGLWHHDEYQWFVLRSKRPFKEESIDTSLSFYQKIKRKIKRWRIKRIINWVRPSTSFHFTHFTQGTHSAAAKLNETFPYDSSGIIYNKPIKSHEICDPYWGRTSSWGLLNQHHGIPMESERIHPRRPHEPIRYPGL